MRPVPRPDWYIFTARPRAERQAVEQLTRRGIEAMAPRTRTFERVTRKRVVSLDQPLYGRYVFASPGGKWGKLHEVPAIIPRPLAMGGTPYKVPAPTVEHVAELVANPPPDPRDPYPDGKGDPNAPPFKVGQSVVVLTGPFAALRGVVERMWMARKQWRVMAAVMIFGRPTPVEFPPGALEPA